MTLPSMLKRPSAFLPLAMSLAALATVLVHLTLFGAARQGDEGAAAHLFQLLIVLQAPVVGWFLVAWLRKAPRQALVVLAVQLAAILAAMAPVYVLKL